MQLTLSNISLRWMLRQIVEARCGIQFDIQALASAGIPLSMLGLQSNLDSSLSRAALSPGPDRSSADVKSSESAKGEDVIKVTQLPLSPMELGEGEATKLDAEDAVQPLHDELKITPSWWILEIIPFFVSWQDEKGKWHRSFRYVCFVLAIS